MHTNECYLDEKLSLKAMMNIKVAQKENISRIFSPRSFLDFGGFLGIFLGYPNEYRIIINKSNVLR